MSFTHMGAGMASPDASSSQMYRRGVLIHCPPEYSVDIVPPMKEGSSWHYGLRVKPLPSVATSPSGGAPVDAKGKRIRGYEIHRKWEDCLDLQRILEKEYSTLAKARRNRWGGGKKGNSVYGRPERAASFDSLPTGPDPKTIPTDIHAFIPRLAAKSSLFRGALGSALVQQRSEEFNEFISALFAPGTPNLVDETRQTPAVREWFGFWRRDRDAMRRRDSDRASIAPSTRRLSIAASEVPPLPTGDQNVPTPPPTSSPLAQTSYESSPISLDSQDDPRQSHETTYGDLAAALDTFPMPPTPMDGPVAIEAQSPKSSAQPISGLGTEFVPIIQRRLGFARGNTARNAAFRNAQFFSDPPTPPLPPLPVSVAPSDDGGSENDAHQFKTIRGPQTAPRTDDGEMGVHNGSPRRAASPSMSSASTTFTRQTTSPRSSQTSDWSMGLSSSIVKALSGTTTSGGARERDEPAPHADEQNEIDRMRRMTLSSLSSNSSKRPPPVPPRSILRRSYSGAAIRPRKHSDASAIARYPVPPVPSDVPTVVYDEGEPEFEIVTHMVLNSYLDDRRSSLLSSAISSNSGSSIRRSMTPSIVSAYSTSSAGRESISSAVPSGSGPAPSSPLPVPTPSTAVPPGSVPANEIIIKAVCRVGDSIVLCRVQRSLPLEAVRGVLATKFKQAAGVQLNLLEHGFVLGYLGSQLRPGGPGTAGGRPGTAGGLSASAVTPARPSGRPGTAPGRPRSSSLSSAAACADPTHLTLIVTQRDWENAVAKHGEKMTVQVLLAGAD